MSTPARAAYKHRKPLLLTILGLAVAVAIVIAVLIGTGRVGAVSPSPKGDAANPISIVVPTAGQVPPAPTAKTTAGTLPPLPGTPLPTAGTLPPLPGTPLPTASAVAESPDGQKQIAAVSVLDFMQKSAATLEVTTPPNTEELAAVAAGSAYEGVLASAAEFEVNGWHQEGQPSVVSTNVISYDQEKSPDTMTLGVCVDSSKVNVLTETGTLVRSGVASDRSLNILVMTRDLDGTWLVSQLLFPDNPNC